MGKPYSDDLRERVVAAIEARGARPIFLPAYSPDLNPIEQLFARLKSFLRKMKARTVEQLWRAIASFLKGVSKEECKAYLANLDTPNLIEKRSRLQAYWEQVVKHVSDVVSLADSVAKLVHVFMR